MGKFVFTMDGNFGSSAYSATAVVSSPTKIGAGTLFFFYAKTHLYTEKGYNFNFTPYTGGTVASFGKLAIITDTIAPKNPDNKRISALSVSGKNGKFATTPITSYGE